jgi:hypothetical protein
MHKNYNLKIKTMKNIKYIFIALLTSVTLTSCYDEDPIKEVIVEDVAEITLTVSSISSSYVGEETEIPFTVTLPAAIATDATVEAKLKHVNGEVVTTVTVLAGSTTADGTLAVPSNTYNNFGGDVPMQISLTGYLPQDLTAGQASVYKVTSNSIDFTPFDRIQWPYGDGVVAGRMTALFDFQPSTDGSARDLDMLMFNASTFDQVETAASGSRWETDIFNDTHPDGDYFIAIDFWRATGDVPWEIFFVHPDQITVSYFNGVFLGAADGDFIYPVINFTKSTDVDGVVSYTFSQP